MNQLLAEAGEMTGNLSPLPDLQRLFHRVQKLVTKLITQVGVVDAAVAPRLLGQFH